MQDVDVLRVLVAQLLDARGALGLVVDRLDLVEVDGVDRRLRAHHGDRRAAAAPGSSRARRPGRTSRTGRRRRPCARPREIFGTVASLTALIIFAPWRMMPWRSTFVPIMKPGTSARNSSGTLNASHSQMKRAALSARVDEQHAALVLGLVGDDADRLPVDAREAGDQLLARSAA